MNIRNRLLISMLLVVAMVMSTSALAFDDSKRGFVLGLGIAVHTTSFKTEFGSSESKGESESGLATSFRLGGGITNNLILLYLNEVSWYSVDSGPDSQSITALAGFTGAGISYYLPGLNTIYLLGEFGLATRAAPFESDADSESGKGFMIGGGYEMSPHANIEFSMVNLTTSSDEGSFSDIENTANSIKLMFNYLFY